MKKILFLIFFTCFLYQCSRIDEIKSKGQPFEPLPESSVSSWVIESAHNPYTDNYDNTWVKTHSGATKMRVHFVKVATESGYDYVYVLDGLNNTINTYTGLVNIGNSFYSDWVNGDTIKVRFYTDGIVNDYYGFKVDYYEYQ